MVNVKHAPDAGGASLIANCLDGRPSRVTDNEQGNFKGRVWGVLDRDDFPHVEIATEWLELACGANRFVPLTGDVGFDLDNVGDAFR
jgi:hypothetical protein